MCTGRAASIKTSAHRSSTLSNYCLLRPWRRVQTAERNELNSQLCIEVPFSSFQLLCTRLKVHLEVACSYDIGLLHKPTLGCGITDFEVATTVQLVFWFICSSGSQHSLLWTNSRAHRGVYSIQTLVWSKWSIIKAGRRRFSLLLGGGNFGIIYYQNSINSPL